MAFVIGASIVAADFTMCTRDVDAWQSAHATALHAIERTVTSSAH
jgi:pentose-5-phosphate-3-epimerase